MHISRFVALSSSHCIRKVQDKLQLLKVITIFAYPIYYVDWLKINCYFIILYLQDICILLC